MPLTTIRTLTITDRTDTREVSIVRDERGFWLDDNGGLVQLADDSDTSVMDVVRDNGFEIVELSASEAKQQIENALTGEAAKWWNGLDREGINEFVVTAQRDGVAAAVAAVEECAAPADDEIVEAEATIYSYEIGGYECEMTEAEARRWNAGDTTDADLASIVVRFPTEYSQGSRLIDGEVVMSTPRVARDSHHATMAQVLAEDATDPDYVEAAKAIDSMPANRVS